MAAEALIEGVFRLLNTLLVVALVVVVAHLITKRMKAGWGVQTGWMAPLDPRRMWCKHPVAFHGRGENGLVTYWCDACGKNARRRT